MNQEQKLAPSTREHTLLASAVAGLIIGAPLYAFSFHLQENVYERPNLLEPLADLLNNPTYLTSYFGVLFILSQTVLLELVSNNKRLKQSPLALPLLITIAATCHEVYQYYHPQYIDSTTTDIVMSWLAFLTLRQLYIFFKGFEDPEIIAQLNKDKRIIELLNEQSEPKS